MKKYFVKIRRKKGKKPNYFSTNSVQNNPLFKLKKKKPYIESTNFGLVLLHRVPET